MEKEKKLSTYMALGGSYGLLFGVTISALIIMFTHHILVMGMLPGVCMVIGNLIASIVWSIKNKHKEE